jgi:hypothetical protein
MPPFALALTLPALRITQLKELLDIREPPEEEGAAPLPVSGEFARAEEALTMRAELERLQTEAASKEREREVLVRTVQATLDEMASIRMPPLDPTLPLAHNLEREIAAPLGDDALDELRDQGQELRHQLSTEYRRRHGKEMKVALKLLEDLGAAESEKARFRKNNQVEEDGDGLMLARQLSTVQAKVCPCLASSTLLVIHAAYRSMRYFVQTRGLTYVACLPSGVREAEELR